MAKGKKRTGEDKAKVKALYAARLTIAEISAKTAIPDRTIRTWVSKWEADKDEELAELSEVQKNRFIDKAQRIIDKAKIGRAHV